MKISFKNIAISGDIGTGKSTLAKNLAKELGWKYLSAGDFFRKWHAEHGIPLENTVEVPPDVDRKIDLGYKEMMKNRHHVIFESRLGGWLARDFHKVFRILSICDFDEAMRRVAKRDGISFELAREKSQERSKALEEKFEHLYGIRNFLNPKYFNLVVDTTNMNPAETLKYVLEALPKNT